MRRALYVRDDDFRLSFTHGNFITLSDLSDEEIERIIEQRLTPLYISVHATDDTLRRCIFRNEKLPAVLPLLGRLIDGSIAVHTQVVVCPGINDGKNLEKTINDLFELYPGVRTLGVVPVGLTRYRNRLPKLVPYDAKGSRELISFLNEKQNEFFKKCGSRFVFAADEFYIMAGMDFPGLKEYEEMAQFENGIGMMRSLLTDFNRRKRALKKPDKSRRLAILTGVSACDALRKEVVERLKKEFHLKIDVYPVENRFWGRTVTVSGLLTGRDILTKIKSLDDRYNAILLPPNCLNSDDLFLDDIPLSNLKGRIGCEVIVGKYSMIDTLKEVLS